MPTRTTLFRAPSHMDGTHHPSRTSGSDVSRPVPASRPPALDRHIQEHEKQHASFGPRRGAIPSLNTSRRETGLEEVAIALCLCLLHVLSYQAKYRTAAVGVIDEELARVHRTNCHPNKRRTGGNAAPGGLVALACISLHPDRVNSVQPHLTPQTDKKTRLVSGRTRGVTA